MCKNCYHLKGRKKKAGTCGHEDRVLYAKGMCKNCYLSKYHKKKRVDKKKQKAEDLIVKAKQLKEKMIEDQKIQDALVEELRRNEKEKAPAQRPSFN